MTEELMKKICRKKGFKHIYTTEGHGREGIALLFKLYTFDAFYYQFVFYLSQFSNEDELNTKLDQVKQECIENQNIRRREGYYPKTLVERQKDENWLRQIGQLWFNMNFPKVTEERLEQLYRKKIWFPTKEDFRKL